MAAADILMLTDGECARRIGMTAEEFKDVVPALEKSGFPRPDPLLKNRRYWPACMAWLDRRYGIAPSSSSAIPALDGEETWN
jgi:hypothetical protein